MPFLLDNAVDFVLSDQGDGLITTRAGERLKIVIRRANVLIGEFVVVRCFRGAFDSLFNVGNSSVPEGCVTSPLHLRSIGRCSCSFLIGCFTLGNPLASEGFSLS